MKTLRLALVGAGGRMGQAIAAAAQAQADLAIAVEIRRGDELGILLRNCEVVVDFSLAAATAAVCRACAENNKPLVLGATGQGAEEKAAIASAAEKVPIVYAANFSVGVNVLFALTRQAAQSLGDGFDRDIVELHHRTKKDAPSGTAKRLADILGEIPPAKPVAPLSVRAGDIVGEHTVIFSGKGERLELTHRAGSRATFAEGALRAARWVVEQAPGIYSMQDVLGL